MIRPGLSRERTSLAWSRTALAYGTCVLLLARLSAESAGTAAVVVGGVGVLLTLGLLAVGDLRLRAAPGPIRESRPVVGPAALLLLAGACVLTGLAALVLIWA